MAPEFLFRRRGYRKADSAAANCEGEQSRIVAKALREHIATSYFDGSRALQQALVVLCGILILLGCGANTPEIVQTSDDLALEQRLLQIESQVAAESLARREHPTAVCVLDEYVRPSDVADILHRQYGLGVNRSRVRDVPFGGVGLLFVWGDGYEFYIVSTDVIVFNNTMTDCFPGTSATIERVGRVFTLTN